MKEYIQQLSPDKLMPFQKHPYQVREDAAMDELVESIRVHGVLSPLLARPKGMSDDEAVILMVDSNLQRENLLPSEKAFAYKMKLEAMKHQGKATSCKVCTKSRTDELIGQRNPLAQGLFRTTSA